MTRKEITREKIINALIHLMEEKSFEKISVLDIINNIHINRGTFYLHFFDKYNLLEQIENEIFDDLNNCFTSNNFNQLIIEASMINSSSKNTETFYHIKQFLTDIYASIDKHADIIKVLLSRNGSLSTSYKFNSFFKKTIINNIGFIIKNKETKIPKDYIFAIAIGVHYNIVIEWINKTKRESPQELAEIATSVIFPVVQQIIFNDNKSIIKT